MQYYEKFAGIRYNHFAYYLRAGLRTLTPKCLLNVDFNKIEAAIPSASLPRLRTRLDYYHKINTAFAAFDHPKVIKEIKIKDGPSSYWFDLMEYARFFPQEYRVHHLFGDITHVPSQPTIVKSRPIFDDPSANQNSILFNLNKIRHFRFIPDNLSFIQKMPRLVWRGAAYKSKRIHLMEKHFGRNPMIDVGQTNQPKVGKPNWQVPYMGIPEQFQYRFILSVEGNDVATNTKWIMASNSLLFMPKPSVETWFMEGTLIPGRHYVQVRDDFEDLEERVAYYTAHVTEAEDIIRNANRYTDEFKNQATEDWLSLRVLERYFTCSGQR